MSTPLPPYNLPPGVVFQPPGQGRQYPCGTMDAVFKADGEETHSRYSISEWWLQPNSAGPGAHHHDDNDEMFYVLGGTMSILAGETWLEAPAGSFLLIPRGVTHDFANRTTERAGLLNIYAPGPFEHLMPRIVEWFRQNPAQ